MSEFGAFAIVIGLQNAILVAWVIAIYFKIPRKSFLKCSVSRCKCEADIMLNGQTLCDGHAS